AGAGQVNSIPPKVSRCAAPSMGHDHSWELFAGECFQGKELSVEPDTFADDIGAAKVDVVGNFEATGRRRSHCRRIRRPGRVGLLRRCTPSNTPKRDRAAKRYREDY